MIGTHSLHTLIQLADTHDWRLALVGDPRQLQAVGRGGMFNELCTTARSIELEHIHRFTAPWEAAASLKLRHGDPAGLDAYFEHGRVIAGTLAEHTAAIATEWITHHADGDTVAITTCRERTRRRHQRRDPDRPPRRRPPQPRPARRDRRR